MPKLLVVLSVIQTIAIAFLAARVVEVEQRLGSAEATTVSPAPSAPQFIPADAIVAQAAPATADAELFRRIVREELAALRLGGAAPAPQRTEPALDLRRADAARRDLDRYIGRGRIEPKEVEAYLDKIAELPAAERTQALRAMTKAMNDGRIEGRF